MQRALLQWKRPEVRKTVLAALKKAGREDLIGFGPDCLVRPDYSPKKKSRGQAPGSQEKRAPAKAKSAVPAAEKPKKPEYKSGWAKPKPKKNARPVKKGSKHS